MKPVNAVQIIREALAAYGAHAATVLTVSLLINGIALIASILAMNMLGAIGLGAFALITIVAQQVSNGAFATLMASRWAGEEFGNAQDVIRPSLARIGALFGAALLYSLGVGIAALFFLLPAIYLATKWAVVFPAIVIGRQRVGEAFKQSSQYTSQAMDSVFAVILFTFLISVISPRIITAVAGGATAPMEMTVIATFAVSALFGPISGLAIGELYLRLAPPVTAGGPTIGRGAWVPVAQQPPAAASGPWVPMPAGSPAAVAATPYAGAAGAPSPYGAAPQPYGSPAAHAAQPYGAPPTQAPAPYGAAAQQPYGSPAQQAPQPYGAPPAQAAPAPYGAPAQQPYGAPAQHAPQPYGAPVHQPAQAYGAPAPPAPQTFGAPAHQPAQAYGAPAPQAYGAPAHHAPQPYGAPAHQPAQAYGAPAQSQPPHGTPPVAAPPAYAAPAAAAPHAYAPPAQQSAPAYGAAPAPYGAPPVGGAAAPGLAPSGGPAGPQHPGREQSVAPPGLS